LLNLTANAVKFTAAGEVAIKVTSSAESNHQVRIRFEVRDTGIGVAPDQHNQLFAAFSQADASTTRRYGGTGLGLAISTRLVEAMDGRIDVDSVLGRGSTFWFELPITVGADLPADAPHLNRDQLSGMRALVVDDNATNRLIVTSVLTSWGLHAVAVPDARTALEELRHRGANGVVYDIAVLDMCMPDMDGLELAQAITADPRLRTTRMIMLTSTLEIDPTELKRAGISQWLTKPVRNSQFYDRLSRLVSPPPQSRITPPPRRPTVRPSVGSGARVLVVEDNELNQLVAEGLVSKLGYTVNIVSNGAQALDALSSTSYAAVLMDCHMPVMDGFEATVKIRERNDSNSTIPIIAMTAGAMAEDRERCLLAGMDDYVSKPIDFGVLERTLHKWIGTTATPVAESTT
jgi:CheY-like chemotaxis protein